MINQVQVGVGEMRSMSVMLEQAIVQIFIPCLLHYADLQVFLQGLL